MTGYGRSDDQNEDILLSVEIKSVNSRFLDFSSRLPKTLVPFEEDAFRIIKNRCHRGRVTLFAKIDFTTNGRKNLQLNHDKLDEYMVIIKEIQKKTGLDELPSIGDLLKLPEVYSNSDCDNENIKKLFIQTLNEAITELEKVRINEGENIHSDMHIRLKMLEDKTNEIAVEVEKSKDINVNKYNTKIKDLVDNIELDEMRMHQEVAILLEKRDITEELVRLNSHYDLFYKYMNLEDNNGKKLNFLLQEIGREINTITSKTDIIKINHIAVEMKNELEKIREQVQNIV